MKVQHKTIKLKQTIKTSPQKVFKALSDIKSKAKWSAPGTDQIKYLKSEFKDGGVETFKCGPRGTLNFKGTLHYEDIIKNERIVYTETVFYKKEKLASSLITIELVKLNSATNIHMTIQVASYCGEQMIKGSENGYRGSLKNLNSFLMDSKT